ncbi:MAG TPA: molecular chaperone HtpG [Stellaceae bacterium]|nr:molecular chaperone HtpG [Stellaceae bacterium]
MAEKRSFQAEVSRLLDIVAHSLYSDKKVFLRELISNASDACDRRRYLALTEPDLGAPDGEYKVVIRPDKKGKILAIEDNGIGMSEAELVENLGTIARSGTAAFVRGLGEDTQKDVSLIGQFGVGFYSAFMVAERVEVVSRKAGDPNAYRWDSDGKGEFTVSPAEEAPIGTRVLLHIRQDDEQFLEPSRLTSVVKTYADHIALPIVLEDGEKAETLNVASALWTRPKSDISAEQYTEFYHSVGHGFDDPWLTMHWKAEGVLEYTSLLFVPSSKPFDLFDPSRKHAVRLYVRRVFVTDDCQELLPSWLRFVKGVVDSEDLPLNISRETLQANPMITKIRQGLVKRVLGDLAKKAADAPEEYATFWDNFGAVLKEGLYEDFEHRETLLGLARFRSTTEDGLTSLDDYVKRMKPGQKSVFTITGESVEAALRSPHLEGFRAKGVEVLVLTDPVDEFWLPAVHKFRSFEFQSVTRGAADLSGIEGGEADAAKPAPEVPKSVESLIALLKVTLAEAVKDVRASERLTDSAVCLVADQNDMDMHLERLLKQHRRLDQTAKRILEINPQHALIRRLAEQVSVQGAIARIEDAAWLLLDQALIVEGEPLPDPTAFARRLAACLERGLGA